MWNNLAKGLAVAAIALGAVAAYLLWERSDAQHRLNESAGKIQNLEQELARVQADVGKVSKEKAEELARLRQAHDEMAKTLREEIQSGEVTITRLADRLTVKVLDRVLFASGDAEISAEGKKVLARVGKVLTGTHDKNRVIRIEGHTDIVPIGPKIKDRFATNWELSTARATNVVRNLVESSKLPPVAFEAAGLGEYHPVAGNDRPEGRRRNRRIEIILSPRVASLAEELPKLKVAPPAESK